MNWKITPPMPRRPSGPGAEHVYAGDLITWHVPPATFKKIIRTFEVGGEADLPCVSDICGPIVKPTEKGIFVRYAYRLKGEPEINIRAYEITSDENFSANKYIHEITLGQNEPSPLGIGTLGGISLNKEGKPVASIGEEPVWTVITKRSDKESDSPKIIGSVIAKRTTRQEAWGNKYPPGTQEPIAKISISKDGRVVYNLRRLKPKEKQLNNQEGNYLQIEQQESGLQYELARTLMHEALASAGVFEDIRNNPKDFFNKYSFKVKEDGSLVLNQGDKPLIVIDVPKLAKQEGSEQIRLLAPIISVELLQAFGSTKEGKDWKESLLKACNKEENKSKNIALGDVVLTVKPSEPEGEDLGSNDQFEIVGFNTIDGLVDDQLNALDTNEQDGILRNFSSDRLKQFVDVIMKETFISEGQRQELEARIEEVTFESLHKRLADELIKSWAHEQGVEQEEKLGKSSKLKFERSSDLGFSGIPDQNIYTLFYKDRWGRDLSYNLDQFRNFIEENPGIMNKHGSDLIKIGDHNISITLIRKRRRGGLSVHTIVVPRNDESLNAVESMQKWLKEFVNVDGNSTKEQSNGGNNIADELKAPFSPSLKQLESGSVQAEVDTLTGKSESAGENLNSPEIPAFEDFKKRIKTEAEKLNQPYGPEKPRFIEILNIASHIEYERKRLKQVAKSQERIIKGIASMYDIVPHESDVAKKQIELFNGALDSVSMLLDSIEKEYQVNGLTQKWGQVKKITADDADYEIRGKMAFASDNVDKALQAVQQVFSKALADRLVGDNSINRQGGPLVQFFSEVTGLSPELIRRSFTYVPKGDIVNIVLVVKKWAVQRKVSTGDLESFQKLYNAILRVQEIDRKIERGGSNAQLLSANSEGTEGDDNGNGDNNSSGQVGAKLGTNEVAGDSNDQVATLQKEDKLKSGTEERIEQEELQKHLVNLVVQKVQKLLDVENSEESTNLLQNIRKLGAFNERLGKIDTTVQTKVEEISLLANQLLQQGNYFLGDGADLEQATQFIYNMQGLLAGLSSFSSEFDDEIGAELSTVQNMRQSIAYLQGIFQNWHYKFNRGMITFEENSDFDGLLYALQQLSTTTDGLPDSLRYELKGNINHVLKDVLSQVGIDDKSIEQIMQDDTLKQKLIESLSRLPNERDDVTSQPQQ